jgi:hypothetical protein
VFFAITTATDFGIMMGALLVAHWRENSASVPHTGERNQREKSGPKTAFDHRHSSTSLDLFDHCAFVRFNNIGPIVALKGAILAQARRFPIDFIGEGSDLHRIRQAIPDPEVSGR